MKKIKAMLKVMLFIIISLIVLILPDLSTYPTGFGKCATTSYSAFKNESRIQYLWDELPEGASFYKGYTQNKLMYAYGLYSFWVEPDQLQGIVDATVAKYHIDVEKAKDKENTEEYRPELWYMMKVQDAFDKHNEGIYRFPYFLPFNEVIYDDIGDYDLVYYSPAGSGSSSYGYAVNQATGQVVGFGYKTIR